MGTMATRLPRHGPSVLQTEADALYLAAYLTTLAFPKNCACRCLR